MTNLLHFSEAPLKVIVAGSRTFHAFDYDKNNAVVYAINKIPNPICEIVSGCCPTGVDKIGENYAELKHIPVKRFPADWEQYGNAAGPIRNKQMAEYADALVLIWDGKSGGSANMLKEAKKKGLIIVEIVLTS